jgi:hypothetical protein
MDGQQVSGRPQRRPERAAPQQIGSEASVVAVSVGVVEPGLKVLKEEIDGSGSDRRKYLSLMRP